jgi:uncharacterized protein with PQ loop repeat
MVYDIIISIPACILSFINYSIPIIPLIKIFKKQLKIEDISIMRIVTNYVISFFWYYYADKVSYRQIKYVNIISLFGSLIGICIYLYFEFKIDIFDSILNALMIFFGSLFFYYYYDYILGNLNMYGKICMIAHLIMLLYPVYLILLVIKNKDYSFIQINISIISLAASLMWLIYGKINEDTYIKISYGVQAILDLIQILLYQYCKRKNPQISSDMINYKIEDMKEIQNEENVDNNYDTSIEIDDDKQKFSKYDNL